MEKQFYTLQELAQLLEVNEMTVRRLTTRGEIPGYKVGRVYRYRVDEIEDWLGKHRSGPKTGPKGKNNAKDYDRSGA